MEQIRILVVDDHRVMREGLRALLETEKDITVVGEAETGRQAVQLAKQLKPSVVIMDIAMPMLNGLEATRQITRDVPTTKILVLSAYSDGPSVQKAVEAGAAGYLLKETAVADVLAALHELNKGQLFLSPAIPRWIRDECREALRKGPKSRKPTGLLTTRGVEVLQLIAEGAPSKQIAAELSISIKTVEKHRQDLMDKLNIHHIAGLTRYAIANGLSRIENGLEPSNRVAQG